MACSDSTAICVDAKDAFLDLIARPRTDVNPRIERLEDEGGLSWEKLLISSDAEHDIGALILKPADARAPAPVVLLLHGTGECKEKVLPLARAMAREGVMAVAVDARFYGDHYGIDNGKTRYMRAISNAYVSGDGHPFLFDTVWDIMRLIDYLDSRDDAVSERIGLIGKSKGGMEGYLAAAVDPRLYATVPLIGVQCFRYGLENDAWQARIDSIREGVEGAAEAAKAAIDVTFAQAFYDRIAPGLYGQFDCPRMLPLIAPRPLLMVNGDSDARTPLEGVKQCMAAAEAAYAEAGASGNFKAILQRNTGHALTEDALSEAQSWLLSQLRE